MTEHDPGDEHVDGRPKPEPWHIATDFARTSMQMLNHFAVSYGGPIYLVGSALVDSNPYDVDIRCAIGKADWLRLFGEPYQRAGCVAYDWTTSRLAWGRDRLKQSRRLSRAYLRNIDWQVQRVEELEHRYAGKPRLRLDTVPDEIFAAGLGDA